jgi:aminoglycoside phosphotransferase (APT) family kinase protein
LLGSQQHGIVYEYIEGVRLTSDIWNSRSAAERRFVAADLHLTLCALHELPTDVLPDTPDLLDRAWVVKSIEQCSSSTPRAPLNFDIATLAERFESAWSISEYAMSIVHVDLKPANLLIHEDRATVIDFGGVCLGDPAIDFGVLTHHFGEDLLRAMELEDTPLAARARCYSDLYHLRRCTRGWTRSTPAPSFAR